jgi:PIN domain nuclease of toxin-antitoxin system
MRLLLDSHVVLWLLFQPDKVPPGTLSVLEDRRNELWISIASLWEMKLKSAAGKLPLPETFYPAMTEAGMAFLSISLAHIDKATRLPLHHKDPFDRMLIAQAQVEGMTLVSADRKAAAYDVPLLWS